MSNRLSPALNVVVAAVQKAGRRLLRDFGEVEQLQVSVKGPGDFVSQADLRAEESLRVDLGRARPGFGFLMEEGGASGPADWEWRWVVDPLDGTSNFLHGIPHWAISVGVEKRIDADRTELMAGVVYNPAADELFWAEKGVGAFLNDRRLRVSGRRDLREALFATGLPFGTTPHRAATLHAVDTLLPQTAGIRRFGAAALDLAWVAAGRYDGYFEYRLHPWDLAAGVVLVREAGGYATDPDGGEPLPSGSVVAANPLLHARLRSVVAASLAQERAAGEVACS